MTLPDRIRQAIAPAHMRIEQTQFAQQMANGQMRRDVYAFGLRHLQTLHHGLEELFISTAESWPLLASLYNSGTMDRTEAIQRDLAALNEDTSPLGHERIEQFLDQARQWSERSPWAIVGVLYVIEGSRMGSMVLTRSLAKAFQIEPRPGIGLDYHVEGMQTRPVDWQKFKAALLSLPLSSEQADDVCQAAISTMDALVELYSALSVDQQTPVSVA
jgi:heme oxygenase